MICPVYPIRVPAELQGPTRVQRKCLLFNLPNEILFHIFSFLPDPIDSTCLALCSNLLLQIAGSIHAPTLFAPAHTGREWLMDTHGQKVSKELLKWNGDFFAAMEDMATEMAEMIRDPARAVQMNNRQDGLLRTSRGGLRDEKGITVHWDVKRDRSMFAIDPCQCERPIELLGRIGITRPLVVVEDGEGRGGKRLVPGNRTWRICQTCQRFRPVGYHYWIRRGKAVLRETHATLSLETTHFSSPLDTTIPERIPDAVMDIAAIADITVPPEPDSLDEERLIGLEDSIETRKTEMEMAQWGIAALNWAQWWLRECPECYMHGRKDRKAEEVQRWYLPSYRINQAYWQRQARRRGTLTRRGG